MVMLSTENRVKDCIILTNNVSTTLDQDFVKRRVGVFRNTLSRPVIAAISESHWL